MNNLAPSHANGSAKVNLDLVGGMAEYLGHPSDRLSVIRIADQEHTSLMAVLDDVKRLHGAALTRTLQSVRRQVLSVPGMGEHYAISSLELPPWALGKANGHAAESQVLGSNC